MQVHSMLTRTRPQDLLDFKYGDDDIVRSLRSFLLLLFLPPKVKIVLKNVVLNCENLFGY